MKKITGLILTGIMLCALSLSAQIDEERLDKDLRVAAKVLESLTQGDYGLTMYSDNVEGNFIEGYGVIFSIGGGYSFIVGKSGKGAAYGYSTQRVISGTANRTQVIVAPDSSDLLDPDDEEGTDDFSKIMVEFLIDYSQMINQLEPTDKILVSTKKSDYVYVIADGQNTDAHGSAGITAELLKKDHNDYMAGKITRQQLEAKIVINKENGSASRSKDLDLFSSMLNTVYDAEYTDSYFMSWKPEYQRLEGVGAIYSFKVYSSYDENGFFRMPGVDKSGLSGKDRNAEVERLYPIFIQSMKENMVQYGRTINSLPPNELVILKITLTKCDECSIPKKVQLSVKQSVLSDYNTGKITEKQAIEKVKFSEI